MGKSKENSGEHESAKMGEILQERERLEKVLKDKYRKEVSIMFTDICGYTQFVDDRGDIAGRSMLLKHNQIVLPLIEKHKGKVVEVIGDAVMASFLDAFSAVTAATDIQKSLAVYNKGVKDADTINLRIGINVGEALVDEEAVFQSVTGDVTNVAARIQSQGDMDQILISHSVYEKVCSNKEILCRFCGSIKAKGKADPLKIYRVLWRPGEAENTKREEKQKVRAYDAPINVKGEQPLNVLYLEVNREGDCLKIGAHEGIKGEENTIRNYEEITVSMEMIEKRCVELVNSLNKANRRGWIPREALLSLREIGQVFHDELFPLAVKDKLKKTKAEYLCLDLDDQLVHIPWELLNDGQQFLCQKFSMGRLVKTRQALLGVRSRGLARPLDMLLLADPTRDLKDAYTEGKQLRDFMDKHSEFVNVSLHSDKIFADSIKEKLRNFDIVHFAGHADYDPKRPEKSGWRLSSGSLTTTDIIKMAGTATMPALIFSNACQSARTGEWSVPDTFEHDIFGLANAFLLAGVKHYMGTFWEISDEPSRQFAMEFYKNMLSGKTTGESVRLARNRLIDTYGEETIVWASYLLYGDPTFNYMAHISAQPPRTEHKPSHIPKSSSEVRTREEVIDFSTREVSRKKTKWITITAGIVALVALIFWIYEAYLDNGINEYKKTAMEHYLAGNYSEAARISQLIQSKQPENSISNVILGNISFFKGNLEKARSHFQMAINPAQGTKSDRAEAMIGLGRIASLEDKIDQALEYYHSAAKLAPENSQAYVSQAVIMDQEGRYDDALRLLGIAHAHSPGDSSITVYSRNIQGKADFLLNQEKQMRIDQLVRDLLDKFEKSDATPSYDRWTSRPLTAWFMDFEVTGYGLQEGQERLLKSSIVDYLIGNTRVQIVERALLDKLMSELKIGVSKLADRDSALSLGRIMAARVILSSRVINAEEKIHISIRLIETETGEVTAVVNETFSRGASLPVISEKVSENLAEKFSVNYPLRAKVHKTKNGDLILNIGKNQGVAMGQQFKGIDFDLVAKIIMVEEARSVASIQNSNADILPGFRMEITP